MSKMMPSETLETLLPARNLTLKVLWEGYGKWWCSLSSKTGYARYFSTDGEHFLVVWEGYPGSYDYYGDFADDAHFYNAVVKGDYYFYRISEHPHKSLDALRTAMILEWGEGLETAYRAGVALHEFTQNSLRVIYEILDPYGEMWKSTADTPNCHYKVTVKDQSSYLSLWHGDADIFKSDEFAEYDGPIIQQSPSLRYAELCVRILCMPERIVLLERRALDADWFTPAYRELHTISVSEVDKLKTNVETAIKNLTWLSL